MESELSGIFQVKLVTKNTVRGSPGTQFMHMRDNKSIPGDVKSCSEFCTFFSLHQLIKVPARITCDRATIIDHILASYPERVTQQGIIDVGLFDHQLIFCARKIPRIKIARSNKLNSARSSITRLIFLRKLQLV